MSQEDFANSVRKELKKIKQEIKLVYDRMGMLFDLSEEFTPQEVGLVYYKYNIMLLLVIRYQEVPYILYF